MNSVKIPTFSELKELFIHLEDSGYQDAITSFSKVNLAARYKVDASPGLTEEDTQFLYLRERDSGHISSGASFIGEAFLITDTMALAIFYINKVQLEKFNEYYTVSDQPEYSKPWADLMFITSAACENNASRIKSRKNIVDRINPYHRRVSLADWLLDRAISLRRTGHLIQLHKDLKIGSLSRIEKYKQKLLEG